MGSKLLIVCCLVLSAAKLGLSVKQDEKIQLPTRNETLNGISFQYNYDDYYDYYDYYYYYDEDHGFDEDFCANYYDYDSATYVDGGWADLFPHPDDCTLAIWCFGDRLAVGGCPEGLYFDIFDGVCDYRDQVTCMGDDYDYSVDDEACPPANSGEIRFFPSDYCDSYYICIGGQRVLFQCPDGLHWNKDENRCENSRTAGCLDGPEPLPDCDIGFVGPLPHPNNCNWFVFCSGNGSRMVQSCRHLFHFDIISNSCVFHADAICIKRFMNL